MITFKLFLIICFLAPMISFAQTIKFGNTDVEFGQKISFYNNIWDEGNQIESDDKDITIYEGENITGSFYKGKLISITVTAYNNEPYPSNSEIEEIINNMEMFDSKIGSVNESAVETTEYYKSDKFYIIRQSVRMFTNYIITPIKYANKLKVR